MQPVGAEDQQETIGGILRTVETMILPSLATREYFQKNPFVFSTHSVEGAQPEDVLADVPTSFLGGFVTDILLPFLTLQGGLAAETNFVAQMTRDQARDLWVHQGLGALVRQSHNQWLDQFLKTIGDTVDSFLEGEEGENLKANGGVRTMNKLARELRLHLAQELFAATEYGSPYRLIFVKMSGLESLLCNVQGKVQEQKVLGAMINLGYSAGVFLHQLIVQKQQQQQQQQESLDIIMSMEDKAFFVMAIRKHLLKKFGTEVQMVAQPDHMVGDTKSNKYRPPLIPGLPVENEVSNSDRLQPVDQAYYSELIKELDMEEDVRMGSSGIFLGTGEGCGDSSPLLVAAVEESPATAAPKKKRKNSKHKREKSSTGRNKRNGRTRVG